MIESQCKGKQLIANFKVVTEIEYQIRWLHSDHLVSQAYNMQHIEFENNSREIAAARFQGFRMVYVTDRPMSVEACFQTVGQSMHV